MTEHGFASGSTKGRLGLAGVRVWALHAAALLLCACSGSTDVVGVLPAEVEVDELEASSPSSESGAQLGNGTGTTGEFLIVAGMDMGDWDGPALTWPFATSLRDFFNESSGRRFGPPPRVERQVIAAMGKDTRPNDVRFVAPPREVAERLRDTFLDAEVELAGGMAARVMRDWRSDEYRVVLRTVGGGKPGSGSCGFASSHHGGACAEESADDFEHP